MGKHCLTQHEALEFHLAPLRAPDPSSKKQVSGGAAAEKNESTFTPWRGKRKEGGHQQGGSV